MKNESNEKNNFTLVSAVPTRIEFMTPPSPRGVKYHLFWYFWISLRLILPYTLYDCLYSLCTGNHCHYYQFSVHAECYLCRILWARQRAYQSLKLWPKTTKSSREGPRRTNRSSWGSFLPPPFFQSIYNYEFLFSMHRQIYSCDINIVFLSEFDEKFSTCLVSSLLWVFEPTLLFIRSLFLWHINFIISIIEQCS